MAELYTGGMGERREMLKNFILSKRAGEAHYLCSETATYVGGGIKRDRRKKYGRHERTDENRIA